VPLLLVLAGLAAYATGDALFAPRAAPKSPDFVDTLLASRAVIAAIRVAIVAASGFVVASIIALVARGQWLTRVGPVQVSDRFSDLKAENLELTEALLSACETITGLRGRFDQIHRYSRSRTARVRETGMTSRQEEIDKLIRKTKRDIAHADEVVEEIERTLRESKRRTDRIWRELRREGLVRD